MHDVKRILVVSRSTTDCKKAVHYGISLARMCGAQLSILHVEYDPFTFKSVPFVIGLRYIEDEYRAMMKEVKNDLDKMITEAKAEGMGIREIIKGAEPVHEIIGTVDAEKTDLLIMAAHDETRIEHVILGRTNHELVRRLPCSILLVKGE